MNKYFVLYNTTKNVVIITVVGVTISGEFVDQCTRPSLKDATLTARLLSNKHNGCGVVHKLNEVATGNGMSVINEYFNKQSALFFMRELDKCGNKHG